MTPFKAIAAVSLNNVIGYKGRIPWYISDDLKWFKEKTKGGIVVMGKRTFESLGGVPLPLREVVILSGSGYHARNITTVCTLKELFNYTEGKETWICGGSQVYELCLPYCSDLFLTVVKQTVPGDTFFPEFKHLFKRMKNIKETEQYDILHYSN